MTDLCNPFLDYPMTQGWTQGSHATNPAMDYATPVGHVFGAPAAGTYRHQAHNLDRDDPTSPGIMGELLIAGGRWDGHRIRFAHLDHHLAAHGQPVAQLHALAATGNTGYVRPRPTPASPHAGAHVHTYGLTPTGARWNWTLYAAPAGAPAASGDATPFNPREDTTMDIIQADGRGFALVGPGYFKSLTADEGKALTSTWPARGKTAAEFDAIRTACTAGDINYMPPVRVPTLATDVWGHQIAPGRGNAAAFLLTIRDALKTLVKS